MENSQCLAVLLGLLWCCRTGLNCRPLPYQGSALPLSYGSAGWGVCVPVEAARTMPHAARWFKRRLVTFARICSDPADGVTCGTSGDRVMSRSHAAGLHGAGGLPRNPV